MDLGHTYESVISKQALDVCEGPLWWRNLLRISADFRGQNVRHVLFWPDDRVDLNIDVVVDHRLIIRHVERAALDARRGDKFACTGVILERRIVVRLEADFEHYRFGDAIDGDLARNVRSRCRVRSDRETFEGDEG